MRPFHTVVKGLPPAAHEADLRGSSLVRRNRSTDSRIKLRKNLELGLMYAEMWTALSGSRIVRRRRLKP
jgi:hypothetical protein